jgi:hypothetical protein
MPVYVYVSAVVPLVVSSVDSITHFVAGGYL